MFSETPALVLSSDVFSTVNRYPEVDFEASGTSILTLNLKGVVVFPVIVFSTDVILSVTSLPVITLFFSVIFIETV